MGINLGSPQHGWLDIELRVGELELVVDASDAVVDSIRELVELGLAAVEPRGLGTCTFFLEPGAVHLQLEHVDGCVRLEVYETLELRRPHSRDRPKETVVVDGREFARAIWRGLREAESRWDAVADTDWSWPFPTEIVRHLGEKLRS
ncbi:MAG: hypothetical protein AAF219_08575 [Myxococcota bacterium]